MSHGHHQNFIRLNHKMNNVLESRLIRITQVDFRSGEFTFGKPSWIFLNLAKGLIHPLPKLSAQTLALRIQPKRRFRNLVYDGRENANSH